MNKSIVIAIIWIISITLIVSSFVFYSEHLYVNGTIVLGWILFAGQYTWNHSEFLYMKLKKVYFLIINPDCTWKLSVEYEGEMSQQIFKNIDNSLLNHTEDIDIHVLSNIRRMYRFNTLNFELVYDEDYNVFRFSLNKLELSFRRSNKIMENEINYLLEILSKNIKEDTSEYYLNITFNEFNPYYGFFIRRLNANEIRKFNVAFNVNKDSVSINKSSIDIYTTSLQKLNKLSKDYLSLSPR